MPHRGAQPWNRERSLRLLERGGNDLEAIREQGYHKGNAAVALGISRRNLYTKLEKYGVPIELKELKNYIDERFV